MQNNYTSLWFRTVWKSCPGEYLYKLEDLSHVIREHFFSKHSPTINRRIKFKKNSHFWNPFSKHGPCYTNGHWTKETTITVPSNILGAHKADNTFKMIVINDWNSVQVIKWVAIADKLKCLVISVWLTRYYLLLTTINKCQRPIYILYTLNIFTVK